MLTAESGRLCLPFRPSCWQLPHRRLWRRGWRGRPCRSPVPQSPVMNCCHKRTQCFQRLNVDGQVGSQAGSLSTFHQEFPIELPAQTNKAVCCLIGRLWPIGDGREAEFSCPYRLRSGKHRQKVKMMTIRSPRKK